MGMHSFEAQLEALADGERETPHFASSPPSSYQINFFLSSPILRLNLLSPLLLPSSKAFPSFPAFDLKMTLFPFPSLFDLSLNQKLPPTQNGLLDQLRKQFGEREF
jgi:hypothetical protein